MARTLQYKFDFADGTSWSYDLAFDDANRFVAKESAQVKPWTQLEFRQCPHCPLKKEAHPQCPIAKNLDRIVEDSKGTLSVTKACVTVKTPERTYVKECATQEGLRALFGVIMASSGCPHLDWLKPLARFHLPFADPDETLFRVLSAQLLEHFLAGKEVSPAASCKAIEERYANVEKVNHAFKTRIRDYCKADADKNAIAALDVFVQLFQYQSQSNFQTLRRFFETK